MILTRDLTESERETVDKALLAARQERPYYGRAIAALRPVAAVGLGTVAVDTAWRFYVDPEWFNALPLEQQSHLICAHEIEHLLRDHQGRSERTEAERSIWLRAADCEINDDADRKLLPDEAACYPAVFKAPDGLLAEEYLTYVDQHDQDCGKCGGGSGAGAPQEWEQTNDGQMADADASRLREDVAADVRSHVKENGRGSVPAGVAIWADALAVNVTIPWPRLLTSALARTRREVIRGRYDYSYARPNRRQKEDHPLRPAQVAYQPTVGVVVDTSGSMGGLSSEVLSTVMSLTKRVAQVKVYQCDAEVTAVSRAIPKQWVGGGGTDLRPAIELAAKDCDSVVVVTDGETPWPGSDPSRPVVAVMPDGMTGPDWLKTVISIPKLNRNA